MLFKGSKSPSCFFSVQRCCQNDTDVYLKPNSHPSLNFQGQSLHLSKMTMLIPRWIRLVSSSLSFSVLYQVIYVLISEMRCDRPAGSKTAQVFTGRVTVKSGKDEGGCSKTFVYTPQPKRWSWKEKKGSLGLSTYGGTGSSPCHFTAVFVYFLKLPPCACRATELMVSLVFHTLVLCARQQVGGKRVSAQWVSDWVCVWEHGREHA